jgi:aquaporin Z
MTAREALASHWPEYLIEGWALGTFMISAGVVATLLGSPSSPISVAIADPMLRNVAGGIAMGITAIALIHSPWGKRSGAHMNPAVTLTFLRLRKIHGWDAVFFIIAQTIGGAAGVLIVAAVFGSAFTDVPVNYAATMPGAGGPWIAFIAELSISGALMFVILTLSGTVRLARFTGGAQVYLVVRGVQRLACAKLLHPADARCIHCGYEPTNTDRGVET